MKTKFVVKASAWEHTDYVVSIRPDYEKSWLDAPIGGVVDKGTAQHIAAWLNEGGLADLMQIFENVYKQEMTND